MTTITPTARAEICAAACSDTYIEDGELLALAVGIISTIGGYLAKLTNSPELVLTDGAAFHVSVPPTLGGMVEDGGTIEGRASFRRVLDIFPSGRRQSPMEARQIDRMGRSNISLIGDWDRPTRQLIGARGDPGNTINHRVDYWIHRHSARVFVEEVDMVSGVGNDRARNLGWAGGRAFPRARGHRHVPHGVRLLRIRRGDGHLDTPRASRGLHRVRL